MWIKHVTGLLGALLGLGFPWTALQLASPPVGWNALGGTQPYSFFWMPLRDESEGWNQSLLLVDFPCAGDRSYVPLLAAPLPDRNESAGTYDGLIACILPAPNGRVARVRIMDGEGRTRRVPELEAMIKCGWRFDPHGGRPGWQRVYLGGARGFGPLLSLEPVDAPLVL